MKIVVAVMGANNWLSIRNFQGMRQTFMKSMEESNLNSYRVVYYDGGYGLQEVEKHTDYDHLMLTVPDDIHHTYEKPYLPLDIS